MRGLQRQMPGLKRDKCQGVPASRIVISSWRCHLGDTWNVGVAAQAGEIPGLEWHAVSSHLS